MAELLLLALFYIVVICVIGAIALWAAQTFLSTGRAQELARIVIGAFVFLFIILILIGTVRGSLPAL